MSLRFGTDGVRGVALTELTLPFASSLARAAADVLGSGPWLIARDPRASGPELVAAVRSGLAAHGAASTDLAVLPTPALAWWAERLDRPAVMVTASHNPWHDNGIKVFAPGGTKLNDTVESAIEARLHIDAPGPDAVVVDADEPDANWLGDYVEHVRVGLRSLDGLRVVLDVANGAMVDAAPAAFQSAGADVTVIHDRPDGRNINRECGATHPASLARAVVEADAHLGLAFDGDGDRVIAVDHLGRVVDGDRLIGLAALQLRSMGALVDDTVVVTVMSNLGFHRAMATHGINVVTTAVGDRYVLEALDAGGYALGGEQSGHIVYRHLATTGDGLLAALRVAAFVIDAGRPLADLADEVMTSYPQVLRNVRVAGRHPAIADELADEIAAAEQRLAGDGRVLVRASGTEPLIRVMVEAATDELATDVTDELCRVVERRFGGATG
jgi:phosphoglucosamine mutase